MRSARGEAGGVKKKSHSSFSLFVTRAGLRPLAPRPTRTRAWIKLRALSLIPARDGPAGVAPLSQHAQLVKPPCSTPMPLVSQRPAPLRVSPTNVLIVPPFECAWLSDPALQLGSGAGCVSFEVRGRSGRVGERKRERHGRGGACPVARPAARAPPNLAAVSDLPSPSFPPPQPPTTSPSSSRPSPAHAGGSTSNGPKRAGVEAGRRRPAPRLAADRPTAHHPPTRLPVPPARRRPPSPSRLTTLSSWAPTAIRA